MKPPSTLIPVSNKQSDDGSFDCAQNGTSSYMEEKARPDEGASPAPSLLSVKSDESMDRPIAFNHAVRSYMGEKARPDEAPSPALSHLSMKSDQSMDWPIAFSNKTLSYNGLRPDEAASPVTSYFSLKSNQSMDRTIAFKDRTQPYSVKRQRPDEAPSPALSHLSMKSDQSMDRPISFSNKTPSYNGLRPDEAASPVTSYFSLKSNQSMDRTIAFKDRTQPYSVKRLRPDEAASPAPSLLSVKSEESMDRPIAFKSGPESYMGENTLSATLLTEDHYKCPVCTEVYKDPVSIPCGHSYCKLCIEIYWSKPTQAGGYACPQCRKRFRGRPVLSVNVALSKLIEELQKAGFSPALPAQCYAGPEDVACDICPEMKLKAVKFCLTCTASYCETHIRQHYTVPALQRHNLVEATIPIQDSKDIKEIKELQVRVIEEISRDEKVENVNPAKCFYSGFSYNDLPVDVTEITALGRPLDLGMFYDCRNDSFISDGNLWDNHTVTSNRISWPLLKAHLKVLEDDSLPERCKAFEMSPMLRVSALCGLMVLSGAAAFLNHPVQSQHHDRFTLHYKTTTRLDMISQRLLQEGAPTSVINATTATHVIIAVFYGAQAFFVFDDKRISTEKNTEMENVIKKLTTTFSAQDVFSSLNETEKANCSLYDCSMYIDVDDWKSPVSFDKAVDIYGSLPTLLGSKGERAVPQKVWLYPLKRLDRSSVCAALSGVSENLMQQAENILEHLRKQIRVCQDMITDYVNLTVITRFPALQEQFQNFSEFLQEYMSDFQRKAAEIIKSINVKEAEGEKSFQELISNCVQSPFNPENTHHWLEKKKTDLAVLNECRAANITIVKSQEELQRVINDPCMSRVFCFTISSMEDDFLTTLKQHIQLMKNCTLTMSDCIKLEDSVRSVKPVCVSQKVFSDLKVFIAAKETNEDAMQTKFIAAFVPDDGFHCVRFYHAGIIMSRNMKLQTKPNLIQISQIKHSSMSLKMNKTQNRSIESCLVEYRALGDDGMNNTWKQIFFDTKSVKETFIISGLTPGKRFQLRYSVIENGCMSNFSKIMNFHTALAAIPGQPLVNKLNRNTLRFVWQRAEADEDCPVLQYMVEYKEAGLEGWSSVLTQGPQCECTLTVPYSTCYRVRVSAVYEDVTSEPSEETPVPVDVLSIKLSKRKISILLEVLKLQTEKKPVELIDWTDEESEVWGFLQCLPYISQLRFSGIIYMKRETAVKFLLDLFVSASEFDANTEENYTELLTSVCSYTSFPCDEDNCYTWTQCDFLLDLCSHVKDYETQTGRSVLPALQPVYQSAPAVWIIKLSERKISILLEVLKLQTEKKPVKLRDWTGEESEVRGFLQCLPYISQLRFVKPQNNSSESWEKRKRSFILDLCLQAALHQKETIEETVKKLLSSVNYERCDFLLDLWSHVKDYETQTGRSVLPALQPVYQSAPAVWRIKLSERKISILLEVLKLQTEKKPVDLIDWTDEESEVRGFLQCLPYISQLRFVEPQNNSSESWEKRKRSFILDLCLQAALHQKETIEETVEKLLSSVNYERCDFLLDLCSHVKDYETQTGRSVLPALQSVYQSAPAVWIIDLSERKISILLEVLKLQTEKKPVDLIDWTDEESEVRGFLQCLPYISQLRFSDIIDGKRETAVKFLLNLFVSASEFDANTEENYTELLTSVCSYTSFPYDENHCYTWTQCDFLLDLWSHVKDYETQTGRSVLPALQPVYQSAPAVWIIDLSERKISILLEVLKLQTEKKPVDLRDWTDEESEVRGFLQCLPYISQLRFSGIIDGKRKTAVKFLLNLFVSASEFDANTEENYTELLTSVCSYTSFPYDENNCYTWTQCDFLLDLWSHVKDYETQTGRSVLPALQSVYQSAPAVWRIKLSERKISILLEVLKLQTEKKPVDLIDWTDEESEVRGFLQCLPYISQLRFSGIIDRKRETAVKFLLNLFVSASEFDANTEENYTELLTSVCSYTSFPFDENNCYIWTQCDFLLDLWSHVKYYKTQTGRSVLPALQPVYQSAPAVWRINLSERKISILLEVLKLQTEKKPVDLIDWTDEESEVRGFLQCLPYISQLRFSGIIDGKRETAVKFLLNLFVSASEFDANTEENYTELLTSVCSYTSFPYDENNCYTWTQCDFLLDLCSHVKDYETQTGRSVLPALQPVYQSAPAVWRIKLSERKISILLEVLKLQTEKKPVELIDWTDEESEVRGFLQCLPYISQLRFSDISDGKRETAVKFLLNLFVSTSEFDANTEENYTELLTSVCSYTSFPCDENNCYTWTQCDFLLDLCSHVKDYETQTGRSVLPALQPVYQSAPAVWRINLSERKISILLEVLKLQTENKPVDLIDWTDEESEVRGFLQCLPYISQLRFVEQNKSSESWEKRKRLLKLDLCLQAALHQKETIEETVKKLLSSVNYERCDFLLDLWSHVKDYETQTGRSVLPALQPVYQSAPAVWIIKLSERKISILLEVLKLQTEKKPVELIDWTDEESEVRGFLQCLPYISQLRFVEPQNNSSESWEKRKRSFLLDLCLQAVLHQEETIEETVKKLLSSVYYERCDFLLDLWSHVKDYETQTGRSVLPALQPVYQSAPAVWRINLSERKISILLEVLKLQTEKKPVELIDWTDEESEVRGFLQCLPYISQLRFSGISDGKRETAVKFLLNLFVSASEFDANTEENYTELLTSVCSYTSFPCDENNCHTWIQCDFLLDLCSHVKDYETQTGRSVLPALQSVYQSAPAVWIIKLSERKISILLEVLKLQTEKKPVELIDWTDEESEVRGFLQCLPYISQLRIDEDALEMNESAAQFLLSLTVAASTCVTTTGENYIELLTSVCSYRSFLCYDDYDDDDDYEHQVDQCDFLLDLCSHVKDYETQTGRSVLPALQSVYQSAPAVWRINLSERKISILLEVLKLQTEKKPVELIDWTDEESEVRGFLQCLPYISQLRFVEPQNNSSESWEKRKRSFILDLCLQAVLHQKETIEETVKKLLSSVYYERCDFLLDLWSHVKDYETQTGRSVLPALQPVYQSAPAVWIIKLSERKISILLEVLKLQTEKKPVDLRDWTDEESEVRGFLQCLPYISQLRIDEDALEMNESAAQFLLNLTVAASTCVTTTGENYIELLTSVCSYRSFIRYDDDDDWLYNEDCQVEHSNFLLDLWSHVKDYETQTGRSVLPALQSVYQSAPAVWIIKLSERKISILLEVLKLQTEKKPVDLIDWTDEESEVRGFLQCLPYISQLRFSGIIDGKRETAVKFLLNLFVSASEFDANTEENHTELLTSVCSYTSFPFDENYYEETEDTIYQCDFLLDLWSHVKDYETQTGRSVLPALQSVYQSAPAVWIIKLSERKISILLEVLKLQTEKKPVDLIDWTDEESEVRGFLQCLPYISQLRFSGIIDGKRETAEKFLLNLFVSTSEFDANTEENYTELLTSVCSYTSFPYDENNCYTGTQCDFLLDLWSHVKDYETQTGRSVLPALQPVYQSAPAVWIIDLSQRKISILLEVLKLQTEKKPVDLIDWTDEESEVRGFLQCLPYISQLRIDEDALEMNESAAQFLLSLTVAASTCVTTTGDNYIELLTSVCSYRSFIRYDDDDDDDEHQVEHCDFLLDLCSHVKDYETQTGRSVLPALQSVYQSAPAVWRINLSERKISILLEVLKLQTEKKPVDLRDWTDEESEVRGFLQCLPYISQLRFVEPQNNSSESWEKRKRSFLLDLCLQAVLHQKETIEETVKKLLSSVNYERCDFLLDLCSHVKDYETQTGRSVLPALQPVYQSAPAVWRIKLSERKISILLEVLKLQTEKKPVELIDWTDEESEVRGFLQCLPYISQLRIDEDALEMNESAAQFLLSLTVAASTCVTTTGENYIELLTSVCSYRSFICFDIDEIYDENQVDHCDFLLDLCSHVKDYETQTGRSVLPALQPVYQSAPAVWIIKLSERKISILLEVLKLQTEKKPVDLIDWTDEESEVRGFLQCLPYISQLRFSGIIDGKRETAVKFLLNLFVSASEFDANTEENYTELLTSVCSYTSFPYDENNCYTWTQCDFLLDLYSPVKDYETQTGRSVLPALQPVYQSAPAVWIIYLSERKISILLEVLKLQTEKKPVELRDWTDEESEVRGFLQCLPYISQLRFVKLQNNSSESWEKRKRSFILDLCLQAVLHQKETIEETVKKLLSSVNYERCDFLLDLCSRVKDYEYQTGRSVLPALQPVYQSAPAVWRIKLSERKISILLEVLKLQTEKKPVDLRDWTDEESEVRGFLQCLPYISQLRFSGISDGKREAAVKILLNLFVSTSEFDANTEENYTELLTSVCSYTSFPYDEDNCYAEYQCDFLLDLWSHVKDYETQTGRSVLPALQSVYQSAPAVWRIKLSERKISILLEVLKLQTEKKPVDLRDWTDEESEVRGFLQCLPYISQLRFSDISDGKRETAVKFLLNLFVSASEFDANTEENYTELLTSVCSYTSFPYDEDNYEETEFEIYQCDFLLDLCSHVKDYETQTGRSVLPALQSVYQSVPAVWIIDLSERKISILLEVLKLQTEKKPVDLRDWTDEESEVRGFLQCLPYISQLRFSGILYMEREAAVKILLNLFVSASEFDANTEENYTELLTSVCSYTSFPYDDNYYDAEYQCDFLLDLCSHVKDYETQTGRSVLPALQPVYQSAPAVWIIDLSERKISILLEVLKLQTEKKPVDLLDWTDEESEVRGFLQCLPYISQLRFTQPETRSCEEWEKQKRSLFLNLCLQAALTDTQGTTEMTVESLLSLQEYERCDFLLDLCSHVKDYETQTGRSVLPALQPVYQSAPAVWSINLSERKSSILLEVLKLQTEMKPVELIDWTDEESEVRGFLQCLPYISQLRFAQHVFNGQRKLGAVQYLRNLIVTASELKTTSGEIFAELSVCNYTSFPFNEENCDEYMYQILQCDFLLDLWSLVKDYETQTGRSVLPALQSVYQSAPAVWRINLSERKISILLEVLKLQTEKKPVELRDWTDEESEVRGFLQCLPYISQLRVSPPQMQEESFKDWEKRKRSSLLNLCLQAALVQYENPETNIEILLSSVLYEKCDFLLDLYSHMKDYETQTGRSVLPALQPVYQSAPAVWCVYLSERKSSILLEVLKLQTEKKPVELRDWTDEESEVRGFLQCLPYISQLSFYKDVIYFEKEKKSAFQFLLNLSVAASESAGKEFTELLKSVFSYTSFPCVENMNYHIGQCDFLLDLCSHVKDYETQTGRSVLPALQPVYQSAPAVWIIDLSERKISILLEVLKLQTEKKPVDLIDWTDEESEVRGFLQCLPYISLLRFTQPEMRSYEEWEKQKRSLFLTLCLQAALTDTQGTTEMTVESLLSLQEYERCDFLLDLCSHVKDYETQTGRSVLPALQSVYQSAPAVWRINLSERKISILLEVLKLQTEKKPVELIDWTDEESEVRGFLQCLPYISQLRFSPPEKEKIEEWENRKRLFVLNHCLQAAFYLKETILKTMEALLSYVKYEKSDFLLDLWSHVKDYETQTGRSVLPALQPVYQSAPAVWRINLSERKISILLEVLKLQTKKKPVDLIDWTDEESEVRGFLQCLPYISQLRFTQPETRSCEEWEKQKRSLFLTLCLQAALTDTQGTTEMTVESLLSLQEYERCDFLLDLCSHVKDYETQTGRSVLPALQPVYQSAPAVWRIKLSERKISILLEVLKLQTEKKPVELIDWTDEESEVRGFLQCLPYISQLRFSPPEKEKIEEWENRKRLFVLNHCLQAAFYQKETILKTMEALLSYVKYEKSDFLLDLWSHVKDYETQTGRSVLPALQPVYQSAPAVWRIKLSERKISILLEVLKLQTEKKPVELIDWTDEESEVRGFLQCLPYISQLRFYKDVLEEGERKRSSLLCLQILCVWASEYVSATGENYSELLTSVCSYPNFPCGKNYAYDQSVNANQTDQSGFLLDLHSHMKDYESQTGRSVLPALQPVYQSAPAVWRIKLSERKISILLEVLKLQTEKKPVELIDWTDEESEVRGFLQCLPYISQLRFSDVIDGKRETAVKFLLNLFVSASEFDANTEENYTELLTSVCSYTSFPYQENNCYTGTQCDFLLDLWSHVKDYETQTGRSVLPALQPVYQSAPAVWRINLSERKISILLEVLKLQTEKKPVDLRDWTDEESEVRGFLQCLPYISQLRLPPSQNEYLKVTDWRLKLMVLDMCLQVPVLKNEITKTSMDTLYSYISYGNCDFLLDLYLHMKVYETQTGRSVLPALQVIFQSLSAVWRINLSERKSSILLEVLKLQTEKKPVELRDWTDEESEVRGFLQCLPYISQLR
ncbi:uncharacterized protein si:ch211-281l24.3 [Pimephales promelas]|uniref:uncharacterized protein si:ch211-281l24.3 n=1 Tax=Pimephales promelas TaxID=90988 RepID=UPI001955A122|nr:uncharacterized protein si:ch211-281l24.3 [Pimephales promelas]